MSYCRWSSDNWKCDLYCYYDGQYYVTHIASNRHDVELPELSELLEGNVGEWTKIHKAQMALLNDCKRVKIELPYAGETFNDSTIEGFIGTLIMLREAGYNFPDYLLKELQEEASD